MPATTRAQLAVTPAGLRGAVEVDRAVGTAGWVSVGNHIIKANELRAGSRVGVRLDETTTSVFDLDTRELIRVGPNPLTPAEIVRVRAVRPGPAPTRSESSAWPRTQASSWWSGTKSRSAEATPARP